MLMIIAMDKESKQHSVKTFTEPPDWAQKSADNEM